MKHIESVTIQGVGTEYAADGTETWYLAEEAWNILQDEDENGPFIGLAEPGEDGSLGYWEDFRTVKAARKYLAKKEKENLEEFKWLQSDEDE